LSLDCGDALLIGPDIDGHCRAVVGLHLCQYQRARKRYHDPAENIPDLDYTHLLRQLLLPSGAQGNRARLVSDRPCDAFLAVDVRIIGPF
jgi:hypothetical protein